MYLKSMWIVFLKNFIIVILIVVLWASIWNIYESMIIEPLHNTVHPIWLVWIVLFIIALISTLLVFLLANHRYFEQSII